MITALPARLVAVPLVGADAALERRGQPARRQLGRRVGGCAWATRMRSASLYRVLAGLLALIAGTLIANHVGTLRHVDHARRWSLLSG